MGREGKESRVETILMGLTEKSSDEVTSEQRKRPLNSEV